MNYYEIVDDNENYADRWFLGDPLDQNGEEIDAREFTESRYYREFEGYYDKRGLPVNVPIDQPGRQVAFLLASFDMPIVSGAVAEICKEIAGDQLQCLPVMVDSRIPGYQILNVVKVEDCFDETRSRFSKWKPEDGRPERVGDYHLVVRLVIDPERVRGSDIFRVHRWEVALIVSERLKERLESVPDLGIKFEQV